MFTGPDAGKRVMVAGVVLLVAGVLLFWVGVGVHAEGAAAKK